MSDGPDRGEETREFRVEGVGLVVVGGALLAALVGAFYLGRWVERSAAPSPGSTARESAGTPPRRAEESVDVGERSGHFDSASGPQKELEPRRQAAPPASRDAAPPAPRGAASPGGAFFVQVFAGRDRNSAETLAAGLEGRGWPAQVIAETEGAGSLYKVRVGGYAARAEAEAAAERLKREGHPGAWVPP
jgi:cell division protein FtsN